IFRQQEALAGARERLYAARTRYQSRVVRMYKSNALSPLSVLLTSETLSDFYARALMLARIAQRDHQSLADASLAAVEAEYQAAVLDDLKAQDIALRQIQNARSRSLEDALLEQRQLVVRLSVEARNALESTRATNRSTRQQWRDSSIPLDSAIPLKTAVVQPHADRSYLVPEYQPSAYRSLGRVMNSVCSWYGNEFNGRPTASGQIFNQDDFTCASKTLPFGTRLALTRGDRRIIVVVTDRGPFIAGRDLDLSRGAARALGFSGVATVEAEFVEAAP
ncbi:MAG: septal ring lytic transglycosylase RlpA family protein, partial [Coriobacteriia bacterium]|nr:septal ring lytic transglycosylase RlpA family protein [Coriobacteriia bacterium]